MNKLIGVWGASGFGKEVLPLVRNKEPHAQLVFIDDNPDLKEHLKYPVLSFNEFLKQPNTEKLVTVAIADSTIREKLTKKCESNNIDIFDVASSNATILDNVNIKEGAILCGFSTITSNVFIGKSFHLNIYSYVAHDCVIGDYVTFAPSVKCNGNVHIEDYAYIGTGAILKQGTPEKPLIIGRGAIVGMGAVVTKDVPAGAVVIGNPAKPLLKKT